MQNRELAKYLDSVRALYPAGIPLANLAKSAALPTEKASTPMTWGNLKAKLSMLVLDSQIGSAASGPFQDKNGELLKAVITQGLKLDGRQIFLIVADAKHSSEALQQAISGIQSKLILALGSSAASKFKTEFSFEEMRGKWTALDESKELLATYSLTEISADAALKKLFWADLKKVLQKL